MTDADLLKQLEIIKAEAKRGLWSLQTGEATTGVNALNKIRTRAEDAVRHHQEDQVRWAMSAQQRVAD